MLKVLNERYPEFYQMKAKEWVKRLPETLLHGDYHPANHMFGLDENDGKQFERRKNFQIVKYFFYCRKSCGSRFSRIWKWAGNS